MKTQQLKFTPKDGWQNISQVCEDIDVNLIFAFGSTQLITANEGIKVLKKQYPNAIMVGGTSAGELSGTMVLDNTIIATLVSFKHNRVAYVSENISHPDTCFEVGSNLIKKLPTERLIHVFL